MRRLFIALTSLGLLFAGAPAASAASGTSGANTTSNNARVEMAWTNSGCSAGQYRATSLLYWNVNDSTGTLGFQTMLNSGTKLSRWDVPNGDTQIRVPPISCGTATTKTEITRLSDGAKWCVALTQGNGADSFAGRCPGF